MEMIEQFDKIIATFNPKKTDNLVTGMENHIGKRFTFEAMWVIEDGQYVGEWAMAPRMTGPPLCGWIPLCDLDNIERVN